MQLKGTVQTINVQDGSQPDVSFGHQADLLISQLNGRFYTQNFRGNIYSWGKTATALSANSITLTATTTPIIGVWNPSTSPVNLSILKILCSIAIAGNSAVAPGAFVYATSTGNGVISSGNPPLNRNTLVNSGSYAKGFDLSTALTGLTNNLVIQSAAPFGTLVADQGATATPVYSSTNTDEVGGAWIIPPGGVFAVLNTVSTTTVSVSATIIWEEVTTR